MASFITAGNATNGLQVSSDNTGILELKTGTGSGTTAVTFDTTQNAIFAGNVGVGTSSPGQKLVVSDSSTTGTAVNIINTSSGGYNWNIFSVGSAAALAPVGSLAFRDSTNGVTRACITSGGEFLVGTTSADGIVTANQSSLAAVYKANATNAGYNATVFLGTTTRAANAAFDFIGVYANSVGQFRVNGAGVVYAQNTTIQSISDQRLKENIRDATDGLNVINALRTVRYDWKEGYGNDRKDQIGFIAQEVEAVFPEAVSEWQVSKEDETVYKTVGPGAFIPVLIKAIQELNAKVEALEAQLKGNA